MKRGQYYRLLLAAAANPSKVIAAAKTMSLHCSLQTEESSTKDTTGDWDVQEPTELSYDISTGALVRSGETITSQVAGKALADIETIYQNGTPVKWQIANVGGDNNRTVSSVIVSGSLIVQQLTLNGPVGQVADYTTQMQGWGAYTVAA